MDETDPNQSQAPSIEDLAPLFPAYEFQQFIAEGGMGAVYLARQISLDRPVAIKILSRELGDDPEFRASFEAEAKAIDREARDEANASVKFAENSPFPEPSAILQDVYYEVDEATEAGKTGKHFFND